MNQIQERGVYGALGESRKLLQVSPRQRRLVPIDLAEDKLLLVADAGGERFR